MISHQTPTPTGSRNDRRTGRLSTGSVAVLAFLLASAAWAEDWVYRVRPGDNLWELAREYLDPGVGWRRLQEHNQVANPRALAPGSALRFPIAWLRVQPAKARVVAVHGEVLGERPEGGGTFLVEADMELGVGAGLTTQEGSNLTLQFADGSRLLVQDSSHLVLDSLSAYGSAGMVDTSTRLVGGRASGRVIEGKGPGSRFVVDTPTATTSVRGTEFRVAAGESGGRSLTEVLTGRVSFRDGQRERPVEAGYGIFVQADGTMPETPVPLLPAPALEDMPATFDRIPLRLAWQPVEGAAGYRVQIAPDRRFAALLHDATVGTPRALVPDLPDGDFVLRVRGIDRHGLEGYDGERAFAVRARPQPPFAVAPRDGDVVRTARPRFAWTESPEALTYRFQLATDPLFQDPLLDLTGLPEGHTRPEHALSPGDYYWRVGALDAAGRPGPFGDPLKLGFREAPQRPAPATAQVTRKGLTFRWAAGAPGQSYRFQLSRDPDFSELLLDREVDAPEITIPRPRGRGTLYLRAQTLDPDGYAGPFGETQTIDLPCRACRVAMGTVVVLILIAL